ncbi:epimerase [Streptomyces dysideae]|uniref:epimerase n=1 Tax=Streptomyces dysideae TaxID=909626 RepID=UPI001F1F888D|nr:epimerase [Streptomyces dysideae]
MVAGATGSIGSAAVRRPRAEAAHDLLGLARRLPGGSGSRGADRRSVGLSAESCHGTSATPAACSEPSPRPASRGCSTWPRPAPAHRSRTTARSKSPGPPRAPDSRYGRHESPARRLLHQHDASGTGSLFTRLLPVVVGRSAAGIALLRCVPAKALGMLPVLPMGRGLPLRMVHTQEIAEAIATVLHQHSGGPFEPAADTPVTAAVSRTCSAPGLCTRPRQWSAAAMSAAWHVPLQQVDTLWLDMGSVLPMTDTTRGRTEHGRPPAEDGPDVSTEMVESMKDASHRTPVLRPRTVLGTLDATIRHRPVEVRRCP